MASAFPRRHPVEHSPSERSDIEITEEGTGAILQAVSSQTARVIVAALREEPGTAKDVAEAVDTSLQNAKYHLERLCEVDVITPVDTWYSTRGREMTVYAPTTNQLVIRFGDSNGDTDVPSGERPARPLEE